MFQASGLADKLTSEPAIITVVFLASGVAVLKYLPSIVQSFRSSGNGAETKRAETEAKRSDQAISALLSNITSLSEMKSAIDEDIKENKEIRRHFHSLKNFLGAYQLLALRLIEHLERLEGRRITKEREMLSNLVDREGKE